MGTLRMASAAAIFTCMVSALAASAPTLALARTPKTGSAPAGHCEISSLPSFLDQGFGKEASSVADVVEVACEQGLAGAKVEVSSTELYDRCGHRLIWSSPYPYKPVKGPALKVKLDDYGNATAAVWGGPGCAEGESLISARLEEEPHLTVTASFLVLPPRPTEPGVEALRGSAVEDASHHSTATIFQIEFPAVFAEEYVSLTAPALERRCGAPPHLVWLGPDAKKLATGKESVLKVRLDNNGNAFVVVLAGASCAAGESLVLATLEEAPFTQYTTSFTILPPASH